MNSNDKYITVLNITIYKQSVHIRRMHHVRWHACHLASYVGTVSVLTVGLCTALLFMSKHLQYLLVHGLQYACNLPIQCHRKSHFLFLRFA